MTYSIILIIIIIFLVCSSNARYMYSTSYYTAFLYGQTAFAYEYKYFVNPDYISEGKLNIRNTSQHKTIQFDSTTDYSQNDHQIDSTHLLNNSLNIIIFMTVGFITGPIRQT